MCSLYCVGSGYYYVLLFLGKLSEEFYFLVVPQNSCLSELSVPSVRKQSNSLETTFGINILDCLFRVYLSGVSSFYRFSILLHSILGSSHTDDIRVALFAELDLELHLVAQTLFGNFFEQIRLSLIVTIES